MRWLAALLPMASVASAQSPSPSLLVLEKGARSLAIVDPVRLEIVARSDAGEDPHEVVASEDGRFAYISNYARLGGSSSGSTSVTAPPASSSSRTARVPTSPSAPTTRSLSWICGPRP
jgi:hypothetical protein